MRKATLGEFAETEASLSETATDRAWVVGNSDVACSIVCPFVKHNVSFFGEGVKGVNNFLNANELFDPIFKLLKNWNFKI